MESHLIVTFDGCVIQENGTSKRASIGYRVEFEDEFNGYKTKEVSTGEELDMDSKIEKVNSTEAEYYALLKGIKKARDIAAKKNIHPSLTIKGDERGVLDCVDPEMKAYPTKNEHKDFVRHIRRFFEYFESINFDHINSGSNPVHDNAHGALST